VLTFTLDPRRWSLVCAFGRNPLVRGTNRFETLIIVLVVAASLLTVPIAGAVGTAVYDARRQQYAAEVQAERTADPIANSRAKAVGATDVWLNNATAHAGIDGACAGAAILLSAVAAAATLVTITYLLLTRMRNANWERELRCLANDNGGRNNKGYG